MANELPDPELGWTILHEYVDKVDPESQSEFIADCRSAEGFFTSGHISEDQYRKLLDVGIALYARCTCTLSPSGHPRAMVRTNVGNRCPVHSLSDAAAVLQSQGIPAIVPPPKT